MLLFKRILPVIIICFMLQGCGFTPMYQKGATYQPSTSTQLSLIEVDNILNREGQILRNLLIDEIYTHGRPTNPKYKLKISKLSIKTKSLGVRKDTTATRSQLTINSRMSLIDLETNETVFSYPLHTTNSYNRLNTYFTTYVTEDDVTERGLTEIKNQVMTQIVLWLKTHQ